MAGDAVQLREELLALSRRYFEAASAPKAFKPGESAIPVTQKVLDADDLASIIDASLDLWFTSGRFTTAFERALASEIGVRNALFVNSGSSANLLAVSTLTSPQLGERQLKPGDEVITTAVGFPTTVNAIVQNQCVPVFVDVELGTYNTTPDRVEQAIGPRTRAIILAHTLGNPFDAASLRRIADQRGLWLIEDSCDALGSTLGGRPVGGFGQLATLSFYPAHHITTGEGGAVLIDDPRIKKIAESFRDWGRDCWCDTGKDNTCGKRFEWQFDGLPYGYDHKYVYSHIGYNLKATDLQAALGFSQLKKLAQFREKRQANFRTLHDALSAAGVDAILPYAEPGADPNWFGFPITLPPGVDRNRVIRELERRKVVTRLMFAGNIIRQPAYRNVEHRVSGSLENSDRVLEGSFWVGVHPGLDEERMSYLCNVLVDVLKGAA